MASINVTYSDITASYDLPDEIGVEVIIGTSEDCSIDLPDVEGLAEEHCCITLFEDGYAISDLGSGAGTFADGAPLENEYMTSGVVYQIGAATITFVPDEGAEVVPAEATVAPETAPEGEAAPAEAPAAAPAAAPQKKVIKKKDSSGKRTAPRKGAPALNSKKKPGNRSAAAAATVQYNKQIEKINGFYVALVLIGAFYAGMALYSWQTTGNPLPIFLR
ncbi:MAG: FHA domain-containing protein [Akkermansia sp.]|nr:FHA domain-containing protein [Akkermansia sp.]